MTKILNKNQLNVLKNSIQEQVRVRCIPCVISLEEVEARGYNKIKLSSSKFNTIPVLHSEIELNDFGSSIDVSEVDGELINVWVCIHASYEGNGVELFNVSGFFRKDSDSFYKK